VSLGLASEKRRPHPGAAALFAEFHSSDPRYRSLSIVACSETTY